MPTGGIYCRSEQFWVGGQVVHDSECQAYGRPHLGLTAEQAALFVHPDMVDVELHAAFWYPQTADA